MSANDAFDARVIAMFWRCYKQRDMSNLNELMFERERLWQWRLSSFWVEKPVSGGAQWRPRLGIYPGS